MRHAECWAHALCAVLLACDGATSGGRESSTGSELMVPVQVDPQLVAEVARALQLPPGRARELAVEDALLAEHLVRQEPSLAHWIERVALARAALRELGAQAAAEGPPSDVELSELAARRWWELDRPRMVQVAHAVVISAEENPSARAVAERIASQVGTAQSADEFQTLAKAADAGTFSVKVEALAPVTLDGRALDPDRPPPNGPAVQSFDRLFAEAAHRLERVGQLSSVVRTPFGYHVLYLKRVIEPRQLSLIERHELLRDEIMEQRARALQSALLDRQRRELMPEQERSALSAMEQMGELR